jgi:hypothetical protein
MKTDANDLLRAHGPDGLRALIDAAPSEPVPNPDETRAHERAFQLKWHGERDDTPLKEWLVERMLPKVGKALLVGQWGMLKTFVAFDLSCAVMTKTSFAGASVKRQGGILFIAAEGQDEVRVRLEGIARSKVATLTGRDGVISIDPQHMPFAWIEGCPRLTGDDAVKEIWEVVADARKEMKRRFNMPLALIVIDALMAAAGFKDANDASENQRVMSVLTAIATEADALVLVVDHFGKDVATGTRNSSVKEDASDAVLALLGERTLAGVVSNSRLAIRKIRGAPTGQEFSFQSRVVTIYENAGYDAVTTLVIDWDSSATAQLAPTHAKATRPLPKSMVIFKRAFDYALATSGENIRPFHDNGPEVRAVKREMVKHEFMKTYPAENAKAKGMAFRRCEHDAIAGALVVSREIGPPETAATYFWSPERA